MSKLYLLGSICGIILAIIFCYQHRPYIERTAEIIGIECEEKSKNNFLCEWIDEEGFHIEGKYFDFCGKEKMIDIKPKKECPEAAICIGLEYATNKSYIPCYKSKLKFR